MSLVLATCGVDVWIQWVVFTAVSAITCDAEGRLYVLDAERGLVHIMKATDYARNFHDAVDLYNIGDYKGSALLWQHIMAVGGTSFYAENYLAQCLYEQGDYAGAAEHYQLAGNIDGYSDAYWQIRNDDIAMLLPYVVAAVVVCSAGVSALPQPMAVSMRLSRVITHISMLTRRRIGFMMENLLK